MANTRFRRNPSGWLNRLPGDCPVTWTLLGTNAVTFVVAFVGGGWLWNGLIFRTYAFLSTPWSAFTYPLLGTGHPLWLLIGGYVFWLFGGSLERSWGKRDYILFLILVSGASAISLWLGSMVIGRSTILSGFWLPLSAAIVAWSAINPYERLLLYFVIPVEARWLGVLSVALLFFSFPFPLGLFSLAGSGVAWWYTRRGRYRFSFVLPSFPSMRRHRTPLHEDRFTLNPIELFLRWQRRRRFLRLMKQAGLRDLDRH